MLCSVAGVTCAAPSFRRWMSEPAAAAAEEAEQRPAVRALKRLLDAPLRVRGRDAAAQGWR